MTATQVTRSQVGFLTLCVVSFLVGWHALAGTFSLALHDDEYTHILLILPVSILLIFFERKSLRAVLTRGVRPGSAFLLAAVLICGCAYALPVTADVRLSAAMLALVVWWIGAFLFCFGMSASRQVLFPLCFLFCLVPIPRVALDRIISLLQLGSAWAAHALFAVMRVPVVQNGVFLTIPGLTLQVAQECSSIRSSSMLLVTTTVLAQLLLRSPWQKALVILFAVPLSIVKNGLRICTIAMLGTRVDPGYLTGRLHHQGGIIFFAIALLCIFGLLWLFRRGEGMSPASTPSQP